MRITKSAKLTAPWTISNAAIKLDPSYIDALNNRGLAYFGRGAYDLAIEDFDRVLKLNPNDADAIRNRADALAKKSK
jgi:tetratricopeptide (TPR) repeat protein